MCTCDDNVDGGADDVDLPRRAFQEGPVTPAHRLLWSPRAGINVRWEVSGLSRPPRHLLCFILLFYPVRSSRRTWMIVLADAAGLRNVSERSCRLRTCRCRPLRQHSVSRPVGCSGTEGGQSSRGGQDRQCIGLVRHLSLIHI